MVLEKDKMKVSLEEMTWREAEVAMSKADVAIVPIGTTEQHGYHMTHGVDSMVAWAFAKELARQYKRAVVYPLIPYGNSETMMDFPGTCTIQSDTLIRLCSDLVDCIARQGFKKILFVNGHGGHVWELSIVCKAAKNRTGCIVGAITPWDLASDACNVVREQPDKGGVHACEIETAIALVAYEMEGRPDLIDMSKAVDVDGQYPSRFVNIDITGGDRAALSWDMNKDWSPVGSIGWPTKATMEKGEIILKSFIENAIILLGEMDVLIEGKWVNKT